jgi:superfamily II DNA/RNA helicase
MNNQNFSQFKLSPAILKSLKQNDLTKPTTIQIEVIPDILLGKDIIASSKTGSGKSASFVLPILEKLSIDEREGKAKIRVLVLTPTRELTLQVANTFEIFGEFLNKKPKVVSIIGGESIGDQLYDIQQGCDIVVATSGRLLDVFSKKQMNLSKLEFFVLDEADKMLDLGFEKELDLILKEIPDKRQNLLFSATYPPKMKEIAKKITSNPLLIEIQEPKESIADINQRAIKVNRQNRAPLLRELIRRHKWDKVLVFMANKRATDNIAMKFRRHGFAAASFHGDLDQDDRNLTLKEFKEKKIRILFSTDIAARGLHIDDITCVINYDLPRSATDYTHRIGRTGRAKKSGEAISFIDYEDMEHFSLIEKRSGVSLEKEEIKGFELTGEAPKKVKGKAPVKGKRKSKKDKLREAINDKTLK